LENKERRACAGRHARLAARPEATGSLLSALKGLWESLFAFRMRGGLAGFLPRRHCRLQIADCRFGRVTLQSTIYNLQSEKERTMSHYTVEELIARWRNEALTVEQMIGQILQVLRVHEQRLKDVGRAAPAPAGEPPPASRREQ
jgi:hypothetical protein